MLLMPTYLAPSPIHGIGCFASESIRKGAIVWIGCCDFDLKFSFADPVEFVMMTKTVKFYGFQIAEHDWILPFDNARHMNHSEKPNLIDGPGGCDIAACDIPAGTELTCDYRTFDMDWRNKLSEIDGGKEGKA